MRVLESKPGQDLIINDQIAVTILSVHGNRVRLGVVEPPHEIEFRDCENRPLAEEELLELGGEG